MNANDCDVLVIGAGNAAMCAALSAREKGASVIVLERAPKDERGGNTMFTAGAMRVAYNNLDEVLKLSPDLSSDEINNTDFGEYPEDSFFDDIARVTEYRSDPDLADLLVRKSQDTLCWMQDKGVRFVPIYGRQAFKINGKFKFWGGLTFEVSGGGPGLVEALTNACVKEGIEIRYATRAMSLLAGDNGVYGARIRSDGHSSVIHAKSVILASGGFQADTEWRTRYLGPGWDLAKVRGSRFNTGDGLRMALEIGAMPYGNWSGCHAVAWDRNAPAFGDLSVGDGFQKHSYPFGIVVNACGKRFIDEGADFRNYTYAKYGREILNQPSHFAWQVFDSKVKHLLRDEYRIREVTGVVANSLETLAYKLDEVDSQVFLKTVHDYNASIAQDTTFNPNIKDNLRTIGITPPKSNWANAIDTPPFYAFQVTCGVTFTFGGLKITTEGQVVDSDGCPINGLYAAGELVGGIFYFNYPGGSGLTSGSVFGRIAGASAGAALNL